MKFLRFLIIFLLFFLFSPPLSAKENKIYITPFQNKQTVQNSGSESQTENGILNTPTLKQIKTQDTGLMLKTWETQTGSVNTDMNGLNAVFQISAVNNGIEILQNYYSQTNTTPNSKFSLLIYQQLEIQNGLNKDIEQLDKKDGIKCFILGCDYKIINNLYDAVEKNSQQIKKMILILQETENEEEKKLIRNIISSISNQNVSLQNRINYESEKFGLLGIFSKIIGLTN